MKRKQPDSATAEGALETSTPRKRRSAAKISEANELISIALRSPPSKLADQSTPKSKTKASNAVNGLYGTEALSSTATKPKGKLLFSTPQKARDEIQTTPSRSKKADVSAKRKSAKALLEQQEEDWEGEETLAQRIWNEDEIGDTIGLEYTQDVVEEATSDVFGTELPETPSKRGRGRPKGSKNKRSPTPEGDLPAQERYFFQNRPGPVRTSNSTLSSLKLLTHDEYFDQIRAYKDPHDPEKKFLLKLHARSFSQWRFELHEGFNICLYGYGSKRKLIHQYSEWLYPKLDPSPKIVIVNGYTPNVTVRTVFTTIINAIMGDDIPTKLGAQPSDVLDFLLTHLTTNPPTQRIYLMVNSIDAPPLRRPATQTLLARLATSPHICLLSTADSPNFSLLWNSSLLDQFHFVFHDCTTYTPYDLELNVVDDVHELLGRKGRRAGGKEGVGFVLKSLPENARNLYRVLLTETLTAMAEGIDHVSDDEEGTGQVRRTGVPGEETGVDYRLLYQKASEEFICSSEMNFRALLKEFHDHQMIVSRRDAAGTEVLGVPLGKEEMEGVLEDLVIG